MVMSEVRSRPSRSVEIMIVSIVQVNPAVGDEAADRARVVGPVDGVFAAAAERQGSRSHRIAGSSAWNHIRQRRLVAFDLGGRRPCRGPLLAGDEGGAGPLFSHSTDPDP